MLAPLRRATGSSHCNVGLLVERDIKQRPSKGTGRLRLQLEARPGGSAATGIAGDSARVIDDRPTLGRELVATLMKFKRPAALLFPGKSAGSYVAANVDELI